MGFFVYEIKNLTNELHTNFISEIHMSVKNPSYLLKSRHGIYYFQYQIPKRHNSADSRKLFRKSLNTRDLAIARRRACKLYLLMTENEFEWEQDSKQFADLYSRGKKLYLELEHKDSDDQNQLDDFFEPLNDYDREALNFYQNKIETKSQHNPLSSQTEPKDKLPLLSKLLEEFISQKKINWKGGTQSHTARKDYIPKVRPYHISRSSVYTHKKLLNINE